MSKDTRPNTKRRSPQAFKLDDPDPSSDEPAVAANKTKKKKTVKSSRKPQAFNDTVKLKQVPDEAAQRNLSELHTDNLLADKLTPPPATTRSKSGFSWAGLFWIALVGLISLGFGLWVDQLIADLFARTDWLGWLATGFVGLLVLASLAMALREFWGISRMAGIDRLRSQATSAAQNDDMKSAVKVARQLDKLYSNRPDTAQGRAKLQQHREQIIDGKNLIDLLERDLMAPLDKQARSLIMGSAKRVSVVTAISPRAVIDVGYVLWENMKLIRRIANLYGGRPGTLGFWRLTRNVVGHLAVTGTIAVGDGLVQQLVGQGVAAKLSSRLGEGVINGMLTARIGIAALDLCRPLPFSDQSRPSVSDFMSELIS